MVEMYSSMGLVMALHVAMIVSFCFPHVVDVSAFEYLHCLACFCGCFFYAFVVCELVVES